MTTLRVMLVVVLAASWGAFGAAVEHVVVIGVDGLAPFGIAASQTPNLDALAARGASTMRARAVMPTSSSSNWASMIMGAGPEQHGVTSNDWERDAFEIEPTAHGPGGFFPTVFSVLRAQQPDAPIHVFHDWDGFGRLVEDNACTIKQDCDGPDVTVDAAIAHLDARPRLLFVHLDHVDHAGHEHGWDSQEYREAVEHADMLLGRVVEAIEARDMAASTLVFVTSDHGGKDKGHGGATMEEIEIPWLVAGPGVRAGVTLEKPVNTFDTAATIAHVLRLTIPDAWIAKPVLEAFEH